MNLSQDYNKFDANSIVQFARRLEGKTLPELLHKDVLELTGGKGGFGLLVEECYFGIEANSRPEPDFVEVSIELKTSPLKELKNGSLSVKERLVLGNISYPEIIHETFEKSSFLKKNFSILMVFYVWQPNVNPIFFRINRTGLWQLPDNDILIIREDWVKIQNKIEAGLAHELSEGDTIYLGACTKGATAKKSLTTQPNSEIPAKRRAFSFKASYVRIIYEKLSSKRIKTSSIVVDGNKVLEQGFEQYVKALFNPYIGWNTKSLEALRETRINPSAKSYFSLLTKGILGVDDGCKIEEFEKANILFKTIRVNENGKIKESLSFPAFDFNDIVENEWEESDIYQEIDRKYFFVFFKMNENKEYFLEKTIFWNLSPRDMSEFENVYNKTRDVLSSGRVVKSVSQNNIYFNHFPKSSQSYLAHVRPHGRNREDTNELPVADKLTGIKDFTKQSFWINRGFLEHVYNFY